MTHPNLCHPRCLWTPAWCPSHQGWTRSQIPSVPPLCQGPHWCPYWRATSSTMRASSLGSKGRILRAVLSSTETSIIVLWVQKMSVSYRPGFHISPVPSLAVLFLIFITELSGGILNELESLKYCATFRELSFPVEEQWCINTRTMCFCHHRQCVTAITVHKLCVGFLIPLWCQYIMLQHQLQNKTKTSLILYLHFFNLSF